MIPFLLVSLVTTGTVVLTSQEDKCFQFSDLPTEMGCNEIICKVPDPERGSNWSAYETVDGEPVYICEGKK